MPDYKQMYLNLLDNVEEAIQMLKNAEAGLKIALTLYEGLRQNLVCHQ